MAATAEEREIMLAQMRAVTHDFYAKAIRVGCHPFIEFCGLMNEYIVACAEAQKQGIDFTDASTHTGNALPLADYHVRYLGEKLNCIYGPALQDEKLQAVFLETVLGPKPAGTPVTDCPTHGRQLGKDCRWCTWRRARASGATKPDIEEP